MEITVGAVLEGIVSGITKFGAFVMVAPGKQGLVHISEISGEFVSDVGDYLSEGQAVTVKVVGVDPAGRLSLSIKAAMRPAATAEVPRPAPRKQYAAKAAKPAPEVPATFEDKLKRFMQDSDSKVSGLKQYSDKKGARRRGR